MDAHAHSPTIKDFAAKANSKTAREKARQTRQRHALLKPPGTRRQDAFEIALQSEQTLSSHRG
jgi:hypothetical protein